MAWELIPLKELFLQTCWMLHVGENPPSAAGLWRGEGCQSLLSHKTEAFLLCLIAVGDLDANAEVSKWPVISRNAPYLQAWPVLARCEWISCKRLPHAAGCWWLVAWLYVPPVLGSLLHVGANPASVLWWRKHLRWGGGVCVREFPENCGTWTLFLHCHIHQEMLAGACEIFTNIPECSYGHGPYQPQQ